MTCNRALLMKIDLKFIRNLKTLTKIKHRETKVLLLILQGVKKIISTKLLTFCITMTVNLNLKMKNKQLEDCRRSPMTTH